MNCLAEAFLSEVKKQAGGFQDPSEDLVADLLGIANTASDLLLQSANGVDVTRDMCHLEAQFQIVLSIKAYRGLEEAKEIFLRALAVAGEVAQKTIASALMAFLERQRNGKS